MIFTKNRGVIIIDILLALSLATFFIALITESSFEARNMFERAKMKDSALDSFENGTTAELLITSQPFGNDMIEKNIDSNGVLFTSVESLPATNYSEFSGTPFCSVDFSNREIVGSYSFLRKAWNIGNNSNLNMLEKVDASNISIEPITLPVNPLLPLTDLEVRNGVAYISTDSTTALDPDLFVVDIHDQNNPTLLSSINTGPGISSFVLAGKRIFAAAASTANQLHIIHLNSLSSLSLEEKFKLPLPYATATPPFGSSIFYKNGLVYLGTEKWDGDEFSIIDVNNPMVPLKIGGFETGSKINDIFIHDKFAYVADSDHDQLRVLDLNNIANPTIANSFSSSGWNRQEGKVISFFEDGLALGRTSGGFDIASDHEVFVFATTSSTTLERFSSMNIPGGVYGIVADRARLYLATREVDKELQIVNYSIQSGSVLGTSTNISFSLPVAPKTIACDNGSLYILAHSAPVIYEISFK